MLVCACVDSDVHYSVWIEVLVKKSISVCISLVFFFQAEDGIRDLVRSRGLGDVYKRQGVDVVMHQTVQTDVAEGAEKSACRGGTFAGRCRLSLIHIRRCRRAI